MIVVVELQGGYSARVAGPIFAIHQQDVGIAIIVVVNESATGSHGFRQILLPKRAVVVEEVDSSLRSNVAEGDLLALRGFCSAEQQRCRKNHRG